MATVRNVIGISPMKLLTCKMTVQKSTYNNLSVQLVMQKKVYIKLLVGY